MLDIRTKTGPVKGTQDVFALCDLPGFYELAARVPADNEERKQCTASNRHWNNGVAYDTSLEKVRTGDLSGVPESDAYLAKIEHLVPASHAWRNVMDVVGGIPNVPAYLAGHPLNMRRRQRIMAEQAPITIFASLELSAGINVKTMRQRGAAILALVRMLSNTRAVELYACCSVGAVGWASHILIKLDTAPLDLARVSHVLTCPAATRGLGYATCREIAQDKLGRTWRGHWSYGDEKVYRRTARDNFISMVAPGNDALLVAAAHMNDPMIATPELWLADMLKQYGGLNEEAA